MTYKKKELLYIIKQLLKSNKCIIKDTKYTNSECILYINIEIIATYKIKYNFINNIICIKVIKNITQFKNLPLYIALYINPIKGNFKIIGDNTEKKMEQIYLPLDNNIENIIDINNNVLECKNIIGGDSKKKNINDLRKSSLDNIKINHGLIKEKNLEQCVKLIKNEIIRFR